MKESRAALQTTCLTFHITYEHVTIHVERPSIFEARCNLFEPIDPHLLLVLVMEKLLVQLLRDRPMLDQELEVLVLIFPY